MDTPASLLERLRRPQDEQAWTRFVELYTPFLLYWARRLALPPADVADLVQDVFVVLVRKLPDFDYDAGKSFRSWLRTVAINKWRERQRRLPATQAATGPEPSDHLDQDAAEAFEELEYQQRLVQRALELLQPEFSPTTWAAFQEHVIAGKSVAEVAGLLQVRPGTVYAAKSRVLTRLRQEVDRLID